MISEILIVIALILVNGIFAAAEIAIVSVRRTRLQQLVDEGRIGALAVASLRSHPERFLATVQIGITVVGATAAAFGGHNLALHIEPGIRAIPWLETRAEEISLAIIVAMISYLSLVIGELVPKSLALRQSEFWALLLGRPLKGLSWAARPLVWLLTTSSNFILRPFSDRTNFMEARISKEELQQMVEEAAETGALHEQVGEIASRVLEFDKLSLREVMVPRNRIDALSIDANAEAVRVFLVDKRRSRLPVYEGSPDNIVGYVSVKDIFARDWETESIDLRGSLRPAKMFPESVSAIEVLRFMRREHSRLALAVDEHGTVSGLVTFEDLVEELVGEVFSEHEQIDEAFVYNDDGTITVRGDLPIREVNRQLDLTLDEGPDYTTIAGLCIHLAAGIPNGGARLAAGGGVTLVIDDATARVVRSVRILLPVPNGEAAPTEPVS
jgi:putative hemolysin